uniref:DNA primase small subunit PriS n=1 Tax=Fervidicoccus fontis TaxID=683846 RepID=A0A7J3ZJM2_9CREN
MSLQEQHRRRSLNWLKSLFSGYYSKAALVLPEDTDRREWAFQPLGASSYVRHLTFKSPQELRAYLKANPPAHAYYSAARFMFPEIPSMEQKVWLGSDLIFDIDADHIQECMHVERLHVCPDCGFNARGFNLKKCPECGSQRLVEVDSIHPECIRSAARSAYKLVRVLDKDFGVKDARIYFSGNRGFHVHVETKSKDVLLLEGDERREIVDYLKGVGLDLGVILTLGERWRTTSMLLLPSPEDAGWRGRIGEEIHNDLKLDRSKPISVGEAERILGGRLRFEVYAEKAKIEVDEKVTIDLHRLIRVPGSLNGKTGLPVVGVELDRLSSFVPDCTLSPFKGDMHVKLNHKLSEARIFGETVSGSRGERATVSQCVGIYLVLKGLAHVV